MSGKIPKLFIDDLISRVDIIDVIDSRVPLKKAGREYKACCPFHQEKTPSFTVSQQKQFYHCFGCGAHGTVVGFLMDYDRMGFVEAIEALADMAGVEIPYEGGQSFVASNKPVSSSSYDLMEQISRYYQLQLRQHPEKALAVEYLKQRGLTGEIAKTFELGYAPEGWHNLMTALGGGEAMKQQLIELGMLIEKEDSNNAYDRFRERIMFPIRDRRGRVIGFGGRVLGDGTPKYLNSPETPLFHKGQELYGLYNARQAHRELDSIVVVEGYMDVVVLAQYGVTNAVATLGTAVTEHHINELVRHTDEVVFCFDGDRAGKQAAWRALETAFAVMGETTQFKFMFLPEGEDPDSMIRKNGQSGFEQYMRNALPLSEFFYESLLQKADIRKLDGRAKLIEIAKPLVLQLKDGGFRSLLIERLAAGVDMSSAELMRQYGINAARKLAPRKTPATFTRGKQDVAGFARKAITLLLHRPALVSVVENAAELAEIRVPGSLLLFELLEFLESNPNISTAVLLERWRDREDAPLLARLVMSEIHVPDEGLEQEFLDTIIRIKKLGSEIELDHLLKKSQYAELTPEEKRSLRELFVKTSAASEV